MAMLTQSWGRGALPYMAYTGCAAVHSMVFDLSVPDRKFGSGVTGISTKLCYQPLLKK